MLKFNNKIKRAAALIALTSYVFIIFINAVHFHKIDIGNSYSIINQTDKDQSLYHTINSSTDFCAVQTAYNSLQNTILSISNPLLYFYLLKTDVSIKIVSDKPPKTTILHYSLRAPPATA